MIHNHSSMPRKQVIVKAQNYIKVKERKQNNEIKADKETIQSFLAIALDIITSTGLLPATKEPDVDHSIGRC